MCFDPQRYFESRPGILNGPANGTLQPISASHGGNAGLKAAVNTPPRPVARSLSSVRSVPPAPHAVAPAVPSRTRTPQIVEVRYLTPSHSLFHLTSPCSLLLLLLIEVKMTM
jgi:hypothetical protein